MSNRTINFLVQLNELQRRLAEAILSMNTRTTQNPAQRQPILEPVQNPEDVAEERNLQNDESEQELPNLVPIQNPGAVMEEGNLQNDESDQELPNLELIQNPGIVMGEGGLQVGESDQEPLNFEPILNPEDFAEEGGPQIDESNQERTQNPGNVAEEGGLQVDESNQELLRIEPMQDPENVATPRDFVLAANQANDTLDLDQHESSSAKRMKLGLSTVEIGGSLNSAGGQVKTSQIGAEDVLDDLPTKQESDGELPCSSNSIQQSSKIQRGRNCKKNANVECPFCGKKYSQLSYVNGLHRQMHLKKEPITCSKCNKTFKGREMFQKHEGTCERKRRHS